MGSSSSSTSNRERTSAASAVRAACPPDSPASGRASSDLGVESELAPRLADARVEVGGAEAEPPFEGVGVAVVGTRLARRERVGGSVELVAARR